MIQLAIFDMDGLLIDSEPFWQEAEEECFLKVGVKLSKADMQSTMGRRIDEVVAHWFHHRPWDANVSQKDVEAWIVDGVIARIRDKGICKPGVESALQLFKQKHIPAVVASSSYPEIIEATLEKLRLQRYFQAFYSAVSEPFGKPHPGVFLTAASGQGIHPRNCVVFEDSPSGVIAGLAASMKVVAVPDKEHKSDSRILAATMILPTLSNFGQKNLDGINQ